jgi:catechol 2,3-dioxygenase-like lactoylglutathione lyase family enzyme
VLIEQILSKMLEGYKTGKLSRRHLIQSLAALATTASAAPTFKVVALNHIAIPVTDVQRSRNFYQKPLGLPLICDTPDNCFLGVGKNFLTLFQNPHPGLDHYRFAIENFNADLVTDELKREGLKPRRPGGSGRVYFSDPDGLEVQIASIDHRA